MKFHFNSISRSGDNLGNQIVKNADAADADPDDGQSDPYVSALLKQATQK